jgi:hypothetical protein
MCQRRQRWQNRHRAGSGDGSRSLSAAVDLSSDVDDPSSDVDEQPPSDAADDADEPAAPLLLPQATPSTVPQQQLHAPAPPLSDPPKAARLFHEGWNDGDRHQPSERLWYALLRCCLDDGAIVLSSVHETVPDSNDPGNRELQLRTMFTHIARVFNIASGNYRGYSIADEHYRYYQRLIGRDFREGGLATKTSKGNRRWGLEPSRMQRALESTSAVLKGALDDELMDEEILRQLRTVMPLIMKVDLPVEEEAPELEALTAEDRLRFIGSGWGGLLLGQQWQMILRGDRVLEFLSLAADHVACNLRVLIPTSTLDQRRRNFIRRSPTPERRFPV